MCSNAVSELEQLVRQLESINRNLERISFALEVLIDILDRYGR